MLPNGGEVVVSRIEASKFDTETFYVAYDNHRWGDFKPYLFVTNDGGKTFKSMVNNLPVGGPGDFVHVIREDPNNRDVLFVGTSISVYASIDRGKTWNKFAANFPSVPVYDLQIHPRDRELIAATHGRGIWIADIAPLSQMNTQVVAKAIHLFEPKPAFQWGEGPTLGAHEEHAGSVGFGAGHGGAKVLDHLRGHRVELGRPGHDDVGSTVGQRVANGLLDCLIGHADPSFAARARASRRRRRSSRNAVIRAFLSSLSNSSACAVMS